MQQKLLKYLNRKILFLSLLLRLFISNQVNAQTLNNDTIIFEPNIVTFKGYITEVVYVSDATNKSCYFYVFSKEKPKRILFSFKDNQLRLEDTSLIIVFWVANYPISFKKKFKSLGNKNWLSTCPSFKENKDKYFTNQEGDSWTLNTKKIYFKGFDYLEYQPIENKNDNFKSLDYWVVYGHVIFPEMIKSNNRYFIVTSFTKKSNALN